jgi:hypothetical protein
VKPLSPSCSARALPALAPQFTPNCHPERSRGICGFLCLRHNPWVPHPRAARVGDHPSALFYFRARAKALRLKPCHPAEALSGVEGAVEGSAVFSVSVTTLGCPILAQRGWETIPALSSISGPALKRFALLLCSRHHGALAFRSIPRISGAPATTNGREAAVCLDGKSLPGWQIPSR